MRKSIYIYLVPLLLFGCKDFLEPKSQSEYSPTRVGQLSELVLAALPDPHDNGCRTLTGGCLDVMSDDVQTRQTLAQSATYDLWYQQSYVTSVQTLYTWQPDYAELSAGYSYQSAHTGIYSDTYRKLVYVNSVLDYVDRVEGARAEKDYVKAQALALRALYYLNLVNIYGEPIYSRSATGGRVVSGRDGQGVPIRLTGAKENRKMERNTVGEVYDRIVDDLKRAIVLFNTLGPTQQYREYRPTLPMAMLLLARTYLYMGEWELAEEWSGKLIDEWERFEINDLNTIVSQGYSNTRTNPLAQLFWPDFASFRNTDVIWAYGSIDDAVALTAPEFTQIDPNGNSRETLVKNGVYAMLALASQSLIDSFDPDDLRLKTYFVRSLYDHPATTRYRAYGKQEISQNAAGETADGAYRFLPKTSTSQVFGYTLRITEAWLIKAEAQAELGRGGEAMATLSEVMSKRFAGAVPVSYTSGTALECVRAERRREMCFESLRWFDLRRWGQPEIEHVWYDTSRGTARRFVLEQGDPGYTLPMPRQVIDKNPDLSQVPLYGGGGKRDPK